MSHSHHLHHHKAVRMLNKFIKDLSFDNPNAPECFFDERPISISMQLNIKATSLEKEVFLVHLIVEITGSREQDTVFTLFIEQCGIFEVIANSPKEEEYSLYVDCPTLLYPYICALVRNITADGGVPPLNLEHIDFVEMYKQKRMN